MAMLSTVADYLREARVLLQDTVEEYRYSTDSLISALNMGLLEIRRLRPELVRSYFKTGVPSFSSVDTTETVLMDEQYRMSLLYYICGMAQLRDDEDTQDQRAAGFMNKFVAQMLTFPS